MLDSPAAYFEYSYRNSKRSYCCVLSIQKPLLLAALKQFPALFKNVSAAQLPLFPFSFLNYDIIVHFKKSFVPLTACQSARSIMRVSVDPLWHAFLDVFIFYLSALVFEISNKADFSVESSKESANRQQ